MAPGVEGREKEREGKEKGDGKIESIENRRAIRETQRKDSITSQQREQAITGEINKRSPSLAMKAQGKKRGKTDARR